MVATPNNGMYTIKSLLIKMRTCGDDVRLAIVTTENTSCDSPGNRGVIIKPDGIIESCISKTSTNKLSLISIQ